MFKILSRIALTCGFLVLTSVSVGQSVSGSFSPTPVGASANSTLTLNYAGFTPQSLGAVFRLYYRASDFSAGPTFTSTVTDFQGQGAPASGTAVGCTNADTYVTLNWVNFGAAWPASASGQLGTVAVTTAASFNASANVCVRDDGTSPVARPGVDTQYTLGFAAPTPNVTVARTSAASVNDDGTNHTFTFTASNAPGANITVNLTSGVSPAMTGVTNGCGTGVTIAAGNTTVTCNISASNTVPFDGPSTASVTINTGSGYTLGATTTANGTITNNDLPSVTVSPAGPTNVADNGASQTVTFTLSAAAPSGGFAVPITAPASSARIGGSCAGATSVNVLAGATTATCTIIGTANTSAGDGTVSANVSANCSSTCTNGATSTAQINITDDDVPVFNVTCAPASITDSAAQTSTCTFRNTLATTSPLSVSFTTSSNPTRYSISGCASPLAVPASAANSAVATCTVTATANTTPGDGNVTATITPTAGTGYSAGTAGNVSVTDDDAVNVTVTPVGAVEGGVASFSIACTSSNAGTTVTGLTYTIATTSPEAPVVGVQNVGTLTCGTPVVVNIPTVNDTTVGNSRSITLTLAGPGAVTGGGTPTLPGTLAFVAAVADNDQPTVIPTMGAFGLGLLGLLIAGIGGFVQRRRK
jgi:hypothetical protein